jgi:arylsulfatase A-like enzyme
LARWAAAISDGYLIPGVALGWTNGWAFGPEGLANGYYSGGAVCAPARSTLPTGSTLVVFMNDNGGTIGVDTYNVGMRGCKATIWRGGTRAFCFGRWPGHLKPRDDQ